MAAATAAPLHDSTACARPALWVVSDSDTTIYLFGTIHTHDGRAHWFDHAVRRAFDASDELVLETLLPASLPKVQVPATGGLAVARATIGAARNLGMSVQFGADQVLHRAADASGKPIIGLESFAAQLDMYRSLPSPARPAAAAGPASTAAPDPALAPFLRSLVDSWNRGDPATITAVIGEVRRQSPETYRRLFTDRNAAWAKWIEVRLARPGTAFVAVGTGHLVGDDSVQSRLAQAGIRSARVN
ncbi:TraB/GumN family protein [Sphingomonas sp. LHG3406-1]|uniref:TraB/GumN family protein n=1 Tax=Sphingomonas sp. LHG3406-1 TaxID=2804617 RepID=UPI002637F1A0|nr:TraB/GumN family protein [Sphingomonas sp. LHG3406-1]